MARKSYDEYRWQKFFDQRKAIFSFLYSVANIVVIQLATNYLSLISVQCYYTGWWDSLNSHLLFHP